MLYKILCLKIDIMTKENVLSSLSLDEKIRLLNGVGSWNTFDCNGKVPVMSMSDGPHGLRRQTGNESYTDINASNVATCFPTASAIASSWNRSSARKMGQAIAREAKAENVQIMLGCGMNIKRTPLCGRNFEYFSEDPVLSGQIAASYVEGMQGENVGACLKHFAMNNQEKNRQSSSSNVDERTMREIYLRGFEIAVRQAKPVSIMSSYNLINGTYASANKNLLTDILRKDWDFDGIVISDWGANMNAPESLKAGLDLGMPDSKGYFSKLIKQALNDGRISEKDIDAACARIIDKAFYFDEHKEEFGTGTKALPVDFSKQHKTALELALDSAVLLKNDGILPLKTEKNAGTGSGKNRVVAIGSLARDVRFQGGGSSHITTRKYPDIIEELSKDFEVAVEASYSLKTLELVKNQVAENSEVPVLFFCGLTDSSEGEGFDRVDLSLDEEQVSLYKQIRNVTKNVILVTFGGSPFDLSFAMDESSETGKTGARAILHMYLCGEACAEACAMLLTGRANPSGKLAETWPLERDYIKPVDDFDINYKEGVLVGYRYYESKKRPALFEFGYGLSYTNFEYSNLKVEKTVTTGQGCEKLLFNVTATIKNTGAVAGAEIVELYVKNPELARANGPAVATESAITRPCIELRDFTKIQLQPGESKIVEFSLTEDAFSVFSDKENAFCTVSGEYEVCLASSVRNIRLSQKVQIEGETLEKLVSPDSVLQQNVFTQHERHHKGNFNASDSLGHMATESSFIRGLLKVVRFFLIKTSKSKSADDPAVKIMIRGLEENPLESFISTAPEVFSEKLVSRILRAANHGGQNGKTR